MSEENMVYNIAGWSVTLPANWPFLVDAEMQPPQYIYEEPFGRVMVCCSSCAFHDITTDMAPDADTLQFFFCTACEQMGMRPAGLAAWYPPGFATLAYRGFARDGRAMVGFGICAPGSLLMVYFLAVIEEDCAEYYKYVQMIRRYVG